MKTCRGGTDVLFAIITTSAIHKVTHNGAALHLYDIQFKELDKYTGFIYSLKSDPMKTVHHSNHVDFGTYGLGISYRRTCSAHQYHVRRTYQNWLHQLGHEYNFFFKMTSCLCLHYLC